MVTTGARLIISLLFLGILYYTDAQITGWTTPNITGADGTGTLTFNESQATGDTGTTFAASPTGASYTLSPSGTPFSVDRTSGVLTLDMALNYEEKTNYILEITATNSTGATGTATINVTVTDVNEHDPVFSASYSPCIVDESTADTTLTTVTATDQDTSDTITYAIDSGNNGTDFKIDKDSGVIEVNDKKTLNKTAIASYAIVVSATDTVEPVRTATTTVSVTVADSCNSGTAVGVSMMLLMAPLFFTLCFF